MNCKGPYIRQGIAYGCGKCIPCLVNKRREWTTRIILEMKCHEFGSFLTLTYDDDNMPVDGSVDPRELQLFMKRLRKAYSPTKLRFYGVGEYGELDGRPHYHVAVFGMQACHRYHTQVHIRYGERGICCEVCTRVRDLWSQGHTFVGQLEQRSAAYIAGYVTKKIGGSGLDNRHPPFQRMSTNPGIGCFFMDEIASDLLPFEERLADAPHVVRIDGKKMPLGNYLIKNLRRRLGRNEKAPACVHEEIEKKMLPLRAFAKDTAARYGYEFALRGAVQDAGLGRRLQIEGRYKRSQKRRTL